MATNYTYRDMTDSDVKLVKEITENAALTPELKDLIVTLIAERAASFGASFETPYRETPLTISAGAITVTRQAKETLITLETEASALADTLDTITLSGFGNGDYLLIRPSATPREITVDLTNYAPVILSELHHFVLFRVFNNTLAEVARYPAQDFDPSPSLDAFISSGVAQIAGKSKLINLYGEPSAETLATITVTITGASGSSGSVNTFVDEGGGAFSIGRHEYTTATTTAAVASATAAAVNAGTDTHGYTATYVSGNTFDVTAPTGSGASANSYNLYTVTTGGATATPSSPTAMSGGADGTDQDDELDTLNGLVEGETYYMRNAGTKRIGITNAGNFDVAEAMVMEAGELIQLILIGSNLTIAKSVCDVKCITRTLSNAEIKAWVGSPVELVPALTGYYIYAHEAYYQLNYVAPDFDDPTEFEISNAGSTKPHLSGAGVDNSSAHAAHLYPFPSATDSLVLSANLQVTGPTYINGGGTIDLWVWYTYRKA